MQVCTRQFSVRGWEDPLRWAVTVFLNPQVPRSGRAIDADPDLQLNIHPERGPPAAPKHPEPLCAPAATATRRECSACLDNRRRHAVLLNRPSLFNTSQPEASMTQQPEGMTLSTLPYYTPFQPCTKPTVPFPHFRMLSWTRWPEARPVPTVPSASCHHDHGHSMDTRFMVARACIHHALHRAQYLRGWSVCPNSGPSILLRC